LKKLLPFAVFLSVAVVSLGMAGYAYFAINEADRIKFEATADDALSRIGSRVELHLALLRATHAFFDTREGSVSPADFKAFVEGLEIDKTYTGLRGIGFLRLVERGGEASLEQQLGKKIWPETNEAWRLPVVLFEPSGEEPLAVAFDMYSDQARRSVLDAAIREPGLHATGRIQLGQVTGGPLYPGFLVFLRLDTSAAPSLARSPAAPAAGVLYAAFRANELFSAALNKAPLLPVNIEVYDGSVAPDNLLFRSQAAPDPRYADSYVATRELPVAGQSWIIQFRPTAAFTPPSPRFVPLTLGLFGLLLAGAIALLARWQDRARTVAAELNEATTKSLQERELMLQEMKHRIKNSIARVLAIARQTARRAEDLDEFYNSFSARLQAMAASQDMLTRSRWEKADLGELLKIELEQVFGKNLDAVSISGPTVTLNEAATQALGLTFHELATNALKYGEIGQQKGGLWVDWRVEWKSDRPWLSLNWSEKSETPLLAPDKSGFGTRLIDMNVKGELGGTISRHYRQAGLLVELEIPLVESDRGNHSPTK